MRRQYHRRASLWRWWSAPNAALGQTHLVVIWENQVAPPTLTPDSTLQTLQMSIQRVIQHTGSDCKAYHASDGGQQLSSRTSLPYFCWFLLRIAPQPPHCQGASSSWNGCSVNRSSFSLRKVLIGETSDLTDSVQSHFKAAIILILHTSTWVRPGGVSWNNGHSSYREAATYWNFAATDSSARHF